VKNLQTSIYIALLFLFTSLLVPGHAKTTVSATTPIVFSDKEVSVFEDVSQTAKPSELLENLDKFVSPQNIKTYQSNVAYWIVQKVANDLDRDRDIQIDASGWKDLTPYVVKADGSIQRLKSTGFVGSHNPFLDGSPFSTPISKFQSQFPQFTLKAGTEITLLTRVNFHPIFPAKSFSINLIDSASFSEFRRFSLYVEGLLLGTLLALTIFSIFNAVQTKDRVNIYYAIWISIAFLSVSSLNIIDGHRLFEFFIDIENYRASWNDSYAYIISIGLAFAQSISYVLFARHYLGIKKNFPKIQFITNLWIVYAIFYCVIAITGGFYPADSLFNARYFAMPYSVAVGLILITFFICSYLRYRDGFGFALYFTYAVIPYLVFRLGFLFGIIGLSSPFQYLPDQGFGYFLKNPWTNQAFGVCMEALIMALAVISRARWLQSELNLTAKKHTEVIEQQNVLLEAKVEERTQELRQKHEIVVSSMNYASRLQRGQLPRPIRLDGRFESFATLWEPRDTIGGDLYWVSSSQEKGPFVLAVADCTGHGVPGAMLSLLVSNSLERIYAKSTTEDPVTALKSLDHYIRTGLNQDRSDSESDDGCDAAILRINPEAREIEYAGAKIDLFRIDAQQKTHRYSANRFSLGYKDHISTSILPVTVIQYAPGDLFAIVTDGMTDQPGGFNENKPVSFGYRRLVKVLAEHRQEPCAEIIRALQSSFAEWQGPYVRRDDVTVVLFKL
jgi:serine phosphatase RsbU (regulator of sigma subunit)